MDRFKLAHYRRIMKAQPVLYYRLNEASGTTAYDYSGNGYHGTITSGAINAYRQSSPIHGDINQASIRTTGTVGSGNSPIVIPSSFAVPTGTQFTGIFWAKNLHIQDNAIFNLCDSGTVSRMSCHVPWSDGIVYWDCGGCCSASQRISISFSSLVADTTAWNHFAMVSTGSGNTFQGIYANGLLATSKASSAGAGSGYTGGTIGDFNGGGAPYSGYISEIALFWRVLSASEIAEIYTSGVNPQMVKF